MTEDTRFSLVQMGTDWFWCTHNDALIGPFVSQDDAETDARETLGIVDEGDA
jgi:hypothetical protein